MARMSKKKRGFPVTLPSEAARTGPDDLPSLSPGRQAKPCNAALAFPLHSVMLQYSDDEDLTVFGPNGKLEKREME